MNNYDNLKNDPYQEIYDDVEMAIASIERINLFEYCMKICDRIFLVAETDFGKAPLNLSPGLLHDIGRDLFDFRNTYAINKKDIFGHKKYVFEKDADSTYGVDKKYSDEQMTVSLYDLTEKIKKDIKENDEWTDVKEKIRYINKQYLPFFFGLKYDRNDSPDIKFEYLRLIFILYNFKNNVRIDLGYLKQATFFKLNQLSIEHKKGILYLKEMVANKLSFEEIMECERWVNSEENCLRLLDKEIVEGILAKFDFIDCTITRAIMNKVYTILVNNLKLANCTIEKNQEPINAKINVEINAYIFFSEQCLTNEVSSIDIELGEWMNIDAGVYSFVGSIKEKNNLNEMPIDFDKIKEFIRANKYDIAELITDHKSEHKDRVRIMDKNSINDYIMLIRLFQLGFHIKSKDRGTIDIVTLLLLIYLYELCKLHAVDFSIVDKTLKDNQKKNIRTILSQLKQSDHDEEFLSINWEYIKIINWLVHKIYMVQTYRTANLSFLEKEMKKQLKLFWKYNISILEQTRYKSKYTCIEDIRRELISDKEIEKIICDVKMNNVDASY